MRKTMETNTNQEPKHWVLLEHLPYRHSKRLLLILFLYALAFTLLLVGLRMFCHNLPVSSTQNISGQRTIIQQPVSQNFQHNRNTCHIQQNTKNAGNNRHIQQDIADHIIRLHVIAHSDTEEDQALKLKVRDEVLSQIQNSLINAESENSAENIIQNIIPMIQSIALSKIDAEGYDYPVHVVMEDRYFPAKTYGDLTFPPGTYRALCIEIGKAEGKNWWCVLFPSLCFVDETTAEVPQASKEKLADTLSAEAYQSLANQSSPTPTPSVKPEFHSAIFDWIRKH